MWPRKGSCGCDFYDEHGVQQEDCNCAYMPYGDGASFSGFREDPWPVEDWPPFDNSTYKVPPGTALHFRGIRNLDATIDFLLSMGMDKATEVRVTGGSAGGLSTFLHMDRIAARVHAVSPHARVTGHPVVGYFLDHDNEAHDEFHTYPLWMSYIYTMQNLTSACVAAARTPLLRREHLTLLTLRLRRRPDGGLMRTCTEHYLEKDHYKCFMAPHVQQFVETPYFMYNSKFDAWQMQNILQSSCGASKTVKCNATQQADVLQYGEDFLAAFAPVPPSHRGQNGAFITSCICHGCPWSDLVLEGLSAPQALAKWYLAGATGGVKDDGNDHVYVDTRNPNGNGTLVKGPFEECVKFP